MVQGTLTVTAQASDASPIVATRAHGEGRTARPPVWGRCRPLEHGLEHDGLHRWQAYATDTGLNVAGERRCWS
jgi:hypothetical protein